jgi:hypothetical protein
MFSMRAQNESTTGNENGRLTKKYRRVVGKKLGPVLQMAVEGD